MARAALRNSTTAPTRLFASLRSRIEKKIERHLTAATSLIETLDHLDGDPDLEPSFGSVNFSGNGLRPVGDQTFWAQGANDSAGDECEAGDDDMSCEDAGCPSNEEAL